MRANLKTTSSSVVGTDYQCAELQICINIQFLMALGIDEIKAKLKTRAEIIRESWVKAMELRLVQNELAICHQAEGVNHYENCRKHSQMYLSMLKENRVKGYKVIDVQV